MVNQSRPRKKPVQSPKSELRHALDTAAVMLQHSLYSEAGVLQAFNEQVNGLGLYGSIYLLEESGQYLVVRAIAHPDQVKVKEQIGDGVEDYRYVIAEVEIIRDIISSGKACFVDGSTITLPYTVKDSIKDKTMDILAAIYKLPGIFAPLRSEGCVKGVLSLFSREISPDDIQVVDGFAGHVSIALDNARIYTSLRQAEAQYRCLFESANDGILIIDPNTHHILSANNRAIEIIGRSETELQSISIWDFHKPEVVPKARQILETIREKGNWVVEFSNDDPNGPTRLIRISATLFQVNGRQLIQGLVTDITERQRAEEALQESEARFRTLTETTASAIFIYQDEKFIYINPALEAISGYTHDELLQMNFWDFVHPASKELVKARELARQKGEHLPQRYEFKIINKKGEERWIDFTAGIIDYHGKPAGLGTAFDITERKEAEYAVRRRAEELSGLHAVSLDITASLNIPSLLQTIVEGAVRLLNASGGCLYLCDVDKGVARCVVSFNTLQNYNGTLLNHGEGAAGKVAQTGKPLIIGDYHNWPGRSAIFEGEKCTAVLDVPMIWKDRVIGVIDVHVNDETRSFTKSDLDLLTLFADQAAIAIENSRLFESAEKRAVELEAIRQASLSLTASLDPKTVLDTILESALNFMPGAQDAHIFIYHPEDGGSLTFGAALWSGGHHEQLFTKPRPNGMTITVARTGQTIVVPDMKTHPLFTDVLGEPGWDGSIIGLPLKIGSRVVGVMNVSYTQPREFNEAELRVLRLLGDQAAIVIENSRLYEQAATERRHLQLLYDVGNELVASLDQDVLLNRAITLTCRALNGLNGEVFVFEPDTQRLSLRALYGRYQDEATVLDTQMNLALGKGLAGWVAEHRQPAYVPEVKQDPRWLHIPGLDEEVHAALVAPIMQGERLLGVLSVLNEQPASFTADHLDLLQAICQQVGTALSNTERYQQVQDLVDRLADEQSRLESLIERLPVGAILLDADHRIQVANPQGMAILSTLGSVRLGEVLTQLGPTALSDLIAHQDDELPVEIINDGSPRSIFEAQVRPIGGDAHQWVLTLRDVTRERENMARIQMQERLATVGQLAAGIAHDFNNIMAAILVYSDLLMTDASLTPSTRDRLKIIQQQVQRAASLIRQILDFSRRTVMEPSPLDLLPFIKELDKLLARVLPETIHLELTYQPGSYMVNADPTRLQQVFMNLALNARDAMPQGGSLHFDLKRVHVEPSEAHPFTELTPGDWIYISVSDTGEGMPAEVLNHIFEPFFSTKSLGQGTGLGLSQVYGIIKQHEGFIDVQSKPDEGTSFMIYLPEMALPKGEEVRREAPDMFDGAGKTVLVVEDDQTTRDALQTLLKAHNFWVLTASNGIEALRILGQAGVSIALVVTDVVMPEMGGISLYQVVRRRWPKIKVMLITGHPLETENKALIEKGNIKWLQKPFSVRDFSNAVQALLMAN